LGRKVTCQLNGESGQLDHTFPWEGMTKGAQSKQYLAGVGPKTKAYKVLWEDHWGCGCCYRLGVGKRKRSEKKSGRLLKPRGEIGVKRPSKNGKNKCRPTKGGGGCLQRKFIALGWGGGAGKRKRISPY